MGILGDRVFEKTQNLIVSEVFNSFEKIPKDQFNIGSSFFNQQCHRNSVQHAVMHKSEVYMCWTLHDGQCPVVHFINKLNGSFQDNTLGYEFEYLDYYMIKKIDKSEYEDIRNILRDYRIGIVDKYLNGFLRRLCGIKYHAVC